MSLTVTATRATEPADHEILAQRFRPFYRFSKDQGEEPHLPCSWEWFVSQSKLMHNDKQVFSPDQLKANHQSLLKPDGADVRTAAAKDHSWILQPNPPVFKGEHLKDVIEGGHGLYAEVEEINRRTVVISYWTLYGMNETTLPFDIGNHDGDIACVQVVYDRLTDAVTRVSFEAHGCVIESFDILKPTKLNYVNVDSTNSVQKHAIYPGQTLEVSNQSCYQDYQGRWKKVAYRPTKPPTVTLMKSPEHKKYEHPVIYIEWGSHEPWASASGSVYAAPKHNGDGDSFLPTRVTYLGSVSHPVAAQAPFLFFNGSWGDPPSPVFHKSFAYKEGWENNSLKIQKRVFVDRDICLEGPLFWPPLYKTGQVKLTAKLSGAFDSKSRSTVLKWLDSSTNKSLLLVDQLQASSINKNPSQSFIPARLSRVQVENTPDTPYTLTVSKSDDEGSHPMMELRHTANSKDSFKILSGAQGSFKVKPDKNGSLTLDIDLCRSTPGEIK